MHVGQRVQFQKQLFVEGVVLNLHCWAVHLSESLILERRELRRDSAAPSNVFLHFMGFFLLCHNCGFLS